MWCFIGAIVLIYVVAVCYLKLTSGKCTCKTLLTGKTVLITGADKGIGYETVLDLAKRNARVIMACRDFDNAEKVAKEIRIVTENDQIIVKKLDVSSLASVKTFAENFVKEEKQLHVLINNAGIPNQWKELKRTSEGFEKVFATNYLGHFLLTMLLIDLLKKSQPSRIINISSIAHKYSKKLDVSNINAEKSYTPRMLYSDSKLLQILFTVELSRQLENIGVTVNSLHPGVVKTNIFGKVCQPWRGLAAAASIFFKTPKEGAQTTIHLAVSDEPERLSGLYFSDCKVAPTSKLAQDGDLAKKIFEASERYCAPFFE